MSEYLEHERQRRALVFLRVVVAVLMLIHGFVRVYYGGVRPFGEFLTSKGLPIGLVIAWSITVFEIIGSVLLGLGRFVIPLACAFMLELLMGIVLVHFKEGWFVVGLGRNGMEYSVLLMAVMGAVAVSHFKEHRR
jgi:putative oxidoreductase